MSAPPYEYDHRTAAAGKEEYVILDDSDKKTGKFKSLEDAAAEAARMITKKGKSGHLRVMYTSPTPQFWSVTIARTH